MEGSSWPGDLGRRGRNSTAICGFFKRTFQLMGEFRVSSGCSSECPECSTMVGINERYCPSCTCDMGAPNVRECAAKPERDRLQRRFDDARSKAMKNKAKREWEFLTTCVQNESGVVVAMPAQIARSIVADPRIVYANYETLVGAGLRRPAAQDQDRHRKAVASLLFGQSDTHIRYGNLAIGTEALGSYGDVSCRMRSDAVRKRTSFLEANSYTFVRRHHITAGDPIPPWLSWRLGEPSQACPCEAGWSTQTRTTTKGASRSAGSDFWGVHSAGG